MTASSGLSSIANLSINLSLGGMPGQMVSLPEVLPSLPSCGSSSSRSTRRTSLITPSRSTRSSMVSLSPMDAVQWTVPLREQLAIEDRPKAANGSTETSGSSRLSAGRLHAGRPSPSEGDQLQMMTNEEGNDALIHCPKMLQESTDLDDEVCCSMQSKNTSNDK